MKIWIVKETRTKGKVPINNSMIKLLVLSVISSHAFNCIIAEAETTTSQNGFNYATTVASKIFDDSLSNVSELYMETDTETTETSSITPLPTTTSSPTPPPSTPVPPPDCKNVTLESVRQLTSVIEETTVKLTWKPPSTNAHCFKNYLIEVEDLQENKKLPENTTTDTEYEIHNLELCGNYKITVFTIDIHGKRDDGRVVTEKIPAGQPSKVIDLTYKSTSVMQPAPGTTLVVDWKLPECGARCVKHFEIKMWRHDRKEGEEPIISENITANTFTRLDVSACEVYDLLVTPIVNETMRGKLNRIVMTMQPRVTVPPSVTAKVDVGPDFLDLSTDNLDTKSVCYPSIAMFTCVYQGNETDVEKVKVKKLQIENPGNTKRYTVTFEDLLPFSMYDCTAKLHNVQGWSNESFPVGRHPTDEDVPGRPSSVFINETTSSSFKVSWTSPLAPNGKIKTYRLYVKLINPLYLVPSDCPNFKKINDSSTKADNEFSAVIDDLDPYMQYAVQLAASTSKGVGDYSDTAFVNTTSAPSGPVNNFDVIPYPPTSIAEYDAVYTFSWELPCRTNGPLKGFKLTAFGDRIGYKNHSFELFVPVIESTEEYKFNVTKFLPSYAYNVSLIPDTGHHENGIMFKVVRTYPAVPKAYNIEEWGQFDSKVVANPTTQIRVSINSSITKCEEGDVRYLAILVSEFGCQEIPSLQNGLLRDPNDWPEVLSWRAAQSKTCMPQYQTTPKQWIPRTVVNEEDIPIRFVIGDDDCKTYGAEFCNGPLKTGTQYAIVLRLFTETGYSDTQMMIFETEAIIAYEMIILTVCALLVSAFVIGLLILYKKGMFEPSPTITILPGLDEINGKNLNDRFTEMTANKNEKIIKEYRSIDTDSTLISDHTFIAARQNTSKNRYSNIHPFDHNRVVLSTAEGDSDYINASYINGYKIDKEYIACQGPKPETCGDFWRMIIELKVEAIVMLTSFKEGNKVKCAEYFPKFKEFKYYDDAVVECSQEVAFSSYKKRIFSVKKSNESRIVTHYHFQKWLDHDCPRCPMDLIKFVKLVRSERKIMDVPLVVHCSAGVGRTGTFIALDIVIQKIKEEKKLSIFEIVKQLRMQRVKMVQTPGQYIYLYKCIYELMIKEKNWKQRLIEKLNRKPKDEQKEEKHEIPTFSELSPKSEDIIENGSAVTANGESHM